LSITFTTDQQKALLDIKFWWNNGNYQKQVYEIAGYAGTGKTTIIKYFIEQNMIPIERVRFVTFTGKAALVIKRKNGFNATTIHKLIYVPEIIPEKEEIVFDENGEPKKDEKGNIIVEKIPRRVVFNLRESIDQDIDLIVCDECSMVNEKMWNDLLSFSKPIIVMGDRGQFPPIAGESPLLKDPDVSLETVMRQAEDSDIIRLATLARQQKWINRRDFKNSPNVFIVTPDELYDDDLIEADIVLCGKNKTRDELNQRIRKLKGFSGKFPQMGEKIICRNNDYEFQSVEKEYQLINGMIGYVMAPIDLQTFNKTSFKLDFKPDFLSEDGNPDYFKEVKVSTVPFNTELDIQKRIKQYGFISEEEVFEFGYCITTHLAQGSSWKNVVIFDEWLSKDKSDHAKWLYTAITRAEESVILVTKNPGWD